MNNYDDDDDIPRGEEYEFTDAENTVVSGIAGNMRFVGLATMAGGVLVIIYAIDLSIQIADIAAAMGTSLGLGALLPAIVLLLQGLVFLALGLWTRRSGMDFKRIVDTEGYDMTHLMNALFELNKAFSLQKVLVLVAAAFMVLAIVLSIALRTA